METTGGLSTYMLRSQLSLLSLSYLRELDLVPVTFRDTWDIRFLDEVEVDQYLTFDKVLMGELLSRGHLKHLTRLGVMLDQKMFLQECVASLSSLIDLQIFIMTR